MKKEEKVIMYDSEDAAKFVENIKGWVDINGRFWGKDEHMARYSSHTHTKCECGEIVKRGWTKCNKCRSISEIENYNKLPFIKWDGEHCVYSDMADRYFRDEDEIEDYCCDEDIDPKELRLLICEANKFSCIDSEYWSDILPEEGDGELPKKLQDAIDALNNVIKTLPPASYSPAKIRTEYVRS
jgi:hypothetical protein